MPHAQNAGEVTRGRLVDAQPGCMPQKAMDFIRDDQLLVRQVARLEAPRVRWEFRWRDRLRALREVRAAGWVICETPAMEEDALRLQRFYRRIA